jgi:hypothetical protein
VTEAELRAAAEARGIQLTEEQVAAFLAADADGDGVDVEEYINSLDWTVVGGLWDGIVDTATGIAVEVKKGYDDLHEQCVRKYGPYSTTCANFPF